MISNSQNTNFKSKILIPSSAYVRRPAKEIIAPQNYIDWRFDHSLFPNKEGYSDEAQTCAMGFLKRKNARKFFFFHFNPGHEWTNVEKWLLEAQKKLSRGDEKFQGFLIGGDYLYKRSEEQAKRLMDFFHKKDIEFSAFLGQKRDYDENDPRMAGRRSPSSDIFYYSPKDIVKINSSENKGISSIDEYKNLYTDVVINDNDVISLEPPKPLDVRKGHGA